LSPSASYGFIYSRCRYNTPASPIDNPAPNAFSGVRSSLRFIPFSFVTKILTQIIIFYGHTSLPLHRWSECHLQADSKIRFSDVFAPTSFGLPVRSSSLVHPSPFVPTTTINSNFVLSPPPCQKPPFPATPLIQAVTVTVTAMSDPYTPQDFPITQLGNLARCTPFLSLPSRQISVFVLCSFFFVLCGVLPPQHAEYLLNPRPRSVAPPFVHFVVYSQFVRESSYLLVPFLPRLFLWVLNSSHPLAAHSHLGDYSPSQATDPSRSALFALWVPKFPFFLRLVPPDRR